MGNEEILLSPWWFIGAAYITSYWTFWGEGLILVQEKQYKWIGIMRYIKSKRAENVGLVIFKLNDIYTVDKVCGGDIYFRKALCL